MTSERVGALTPDARLYEVNRRSSAYIRWVQQSLNRIMGSGLVTDGVMGPHTRNAVRAFQGQRGLVADGVVGPRTEAALVAAGAASPPGSGGAPAGGPNLAVSTPLPTPGPGYYSYKPTSQQFGLAETIRALQHIGAGWERDHPQGPRIGIGDISKRGGGPMPGHASHQRGVDADIRPARSDGHETAVSYQSAAYSRALTQELVNLIRGNGV